MKGRKPEKARLEKFAEQDLREAEGHGENDFKIELARRAIVRALQQAADGTPQDQSDKAFRRAKDDASQKISTSVGPPTGSMVRSRSPAGRNMPRNIRLPVCCMATSLRTIAAGRIITMDTRQGAALVPGVVEIFTHENRGKAAWLDRKWRDEVAPPGHPFRPLHSDRILFDGQPIALVVAESYEAARDAASLVRRSTTSTSIVPSWRRSCRSLRAAEEAKRHSAASESPRRRRKGIRGGSDRDQRDYRINAEHHNPMELFGTTCVFEGPGKLTIYEKTQGSQNSQGYVTSVFGLKSKNVR